MKVHRVERHYIKKSHPIFSTIDEYCFRSKNLFNYANYIIRQEFINNKNYIKSNDMEKDLKTHELFKSLGSQASQKTLQLLDKSWKSFFVSIKDWSKNPNKYLGRPKLPRYKDKDGRFILMLKNIQFRIENEYIIFSWKPLKQFKFKTNIQDKLIQARFVPKGNCYVLEIVYEKEISIQTKESKNILGIDLGLNNFVTMVNNIGETPIVINGKGIKSYNQYWNKSIAKYRALAKTNNDLHWTNRLARLTTKRNNKMDYFTHKASRWVIDYCILHDIDTIVIGKNKEWKQECKLNKKVNQGFIQLPYDMFINKLKYKCEEEGINFEETEESYTSGTSFIDGELPVKGNYNKSRRIKRGLFKSNEGILINSDVNGAYQITKKVFPNAYVNGIVDVDLHPLVINIV